MNTQIEAIIKAFYTEKKKLQKLIGQPYSQDNKFNCAEGYQAIITQVDQKIARIQVFNVEYSKHRKIVDVSMF
jgi:hypothetical protein